MGAGLRVLVVEDEWLVAAATRMMLECLGYEVVGVASNGAAAVELSLSLRPDVVLMDVQMPGMDGMAATRVLMARQPTCVILVSGRDCLAELAEQCGAAGCASKPLVMEQVPALIREAQERFRHLLRVREETAGRRPASSVPARPRGRRVRNHGRVTRLRQADLVPSGGRRGASAGRPVPGR